MSVYQFVAGVGVCAMTLTCCCI